MTGATRKLGTTTATWRRSPRRASAWSATPDRVFYAVKALEVASGLPLLSNRFVTLALCLPAPILFNTDDHR